MGTKQMTVQGKCPMVSLILMDLVVFKSFFDAHFLLEIWIRQTLQCFLWKRPLVGGAAILIAGFMLKFDSGLLEAEVIELFNRVIVSNIPLGTLADANSYMMMISGGIIMFIAILGLCGAWHKLNGCLWAFIIIVIVLIAIQAMEAGLWIFLRQQSDEWLQGNMLTLMAAYDGPQATDEISKGWNKLFIEGKCCGVKTLYANGGTNNDFEDIPSTWWVSRAADYVPASCCQGVTSATVASYIGSASCTTPNPPTNFYTKGCYPTVMTIINTYSLILLICAGGLFFAQVAAIVCACILIQRKNRIMPRKKAWDFDRPRYPYMDKGKVTNGGRHKPIRHPVPPPPPPTPLPPALRY